MTTPVGAYAFILEGALETLRLAGERSDKARNSGSHLTRPVEGAVSCELVSEMLTGLGGNLGVPIGMVRDHKNAISRSNFAGI